MAWYSQALWLIGDGHWKAFDTMVGYPALADSASYVLYPVALLYRFVGQPGILLLQILAMSSGFLALLYYFNKYAMAIPDRIGWVLLYAFYPAIIGPAIFDWHPDVMMIPGFFLTIWAFEQKHFRLFLLGILVSSATKDVGAAVSAVFGVDLLIRGKWKYGWAALAIGAGVVLLDFLVVMPWVYPHGVAVWGATYGWLGASPRVAAQRLLTQPDLLLEAWTRYQVVAAWCLLLIGFGIVLPFWGALRTPYGLPILAVFAFNGLSGFGPQIFAWHQYWIPAVPFLFAASLTVWPLIRRQAKWVFLISMGGFSLFIFTKASGQLVSYRQPNTTALIDISQRIPATAPVLGMNKDVALLANRSYLSLLDGANMKSSPRGTYAFMDMDDMSNELVSPTDLHLWFRDLQSSPNWTLIAQQNNVWLFEKIRKG